MASWLKVAEDLFEGVDRRAKRVVNELSDEQSELQPSVSSGQDVIARRTKPKEKGGHRQLISESTRPEQEKKSIQLPVSNVKNDKSETSSYESSLKGGSNDTVEVSTETLSDTNKDTAIPDTASSEVPVTEDNIQTSISSTKDDGSVATSEDVPESFSSASLDKGMEMIDEDLASDVDSKVNLANEGTHLTAEQVRPESEKVEINTIKKGQENESGFLAEPSSNISKQQDHKAGNSLMEVQDQLDEAHGLLKSTISTGQSKEARLARVCAGLSSRLQEYKSENTQLEELLLAEREHSSSYEAHIKQLQQDLSASKLEVARVESNMAEALTAKNSEIESLVGSMEVLKIQASSSEGKLASLQANMEAVMRNRELTETRMMQALREELASTERRAEEERIAHNATKMAAVEREVELEHRAVEASNALARIQRTADDSTSKAAELEHKVAVLEVECASLTQELQELEVRNRRGQKKASEEASQVLQMQAWQEEVERARSMQRDAENKLSSLEAELQKMRVEMAGMKRDAEHYSRQEHMELEKRYRELTDLLYHKQTQLEAMASEKAAAEFQLEKEVKRLQEAQVEAERSRVSRRSSALWEEDSDIKVLEPLPLHHRHMAGASEQLQKAVKLLDSGAVRATRFLWRYPVARIILLFYLVFVHFFLMYLLHRLQEQADDFVSREAAMSMGLGNSSLH